jgi:hypothetical protein
LSLLTVVRQVCPVVGVLLPTSVFSGIASNRTMQEMLVCANEIAQRIATDYRDWTRLRKSATLVGDGVTAAFNLPADYRRMQKDGHVWRSIDSKQPMRFVPDTDEWFQRRNANEADAWGEWTLYGGKIHIHPVMPVGQSARFTYLDKNCIALAGGGFGEEFLADDDSFVLNERLLRLGMIWDWKAKKGSPYAEDLSTFEDAIRTAMGYDAPAPVLIDNMPISAYAKVAYPWQLPSS